MNKKEHKIKSKHEIKDLPRIQIIYSDMYIAIQAQEFHPTTKADMILIASSIIEKAYELDHGSPTVLTDLLFKRKPK